MADKSLLLTQSELKRLLVYNPETGVFIWLVQTGNAIIGEIAGSIKFDGYRVIGINFKFYRAHRLAWLYMYGCWPDQVDHINMNRDDNRLANLRLASRRENSRNRGKQSNNKSGYKGVSWKAKNRKWRAQIKIDGKQKCLGYFTDIDAAAAAYAIAAEKYHGEFGRII